VQNSDYVVLLIREVSMVLNVLCVAGTDFRGLSRDEKKCFCTLLYLLRKLGCKVRMLKS
jgi:hypothetical protein